MKSFNVGLRLRFLKTESRRMKNDFLSIFVKCVIESMFEFKENIMLGRAGALSGSFVMTQKNKNTRNISRVNKVVGFLSYRTFISRCPSSAWDASELSVAFTGDQRSHQCQHGTSLPSQNFRSPPS